VGFRPFVRRLALAHGLVGWVQNTRDAVRIEVQGAAIDAFERALADAPGAVQSIDRSSLVERPDTDFVILESDLADGAAAVLPPDLASCADCRREARDPADRRFEYPFGSCVACGPRFSICESLPYDRARTTMREFPLCAECAAEYENIDDRRYHAQPIACPKCGPQLRWSGAGDALDALRAGGIVALRGLGGYQLLCRPDAERRLRERKRRPHKPFAVMFRDLEAVRAVAEVDDAARAALESPAAPIVLVPARSGTELIGAMLPATILHEQLSTALPTLICTSGNLSEEPICISEEEANERLGAIADGFLSHNRPIARPLDDSVVRVMHGQARVFRRARGHAPRAVAFVPPGVTVLALGAHMKSTIALAHRGAIVPSQHLGDLDSLATRELVERTLADFLRFFDARPQVIACDLHPDYGSTVIAEELARKWDIPLVRIQHHHAHIAAVLAEAGTSAPTLGLAWDGTGHGEDGTIWGGESLLWNGETFIRKAKLKPFRLIGGDAAARDPTLAALSLVPQADDPRCGLAARGINAPYCSSMGRLFDAVAGLLGASKSTFEGQAAMELEALAASVEPDGAYPFPLANNELDHGPLISALQEDRAPRAVKARRFHEALIDAAESLAEGHERVALSGGCFQNRLLVEGIATRLESKGTHVLIPTEVPTNDGGISVGQAWLAVTTIAPST
jgi:hydrogenase maturation protein HypF